MTLPRSPKQLILEYYYAGFYFFSRSEMRLLANKRMAGMKPPRVDFMPVHKRLALVYLYGCGSMHTPHPKLGAFHLLRISMDRLEARQK